MLVSLEDVSEVEVSVLISSLRDTTDFWTCFDIAFTLFADSEQIPCLHFLLNDKKELVHDNQLVKIANLVNEKNIQFVASILRDKLPKELDKEEFFIVKLSQNEKLFKIEKK